MPRVIRLTLLTVLLTVSAAPAAFGHPNHAPNDDDLGAYAQPVLFDGTVINDCTLVDDTMMLWELTGSDTVMSAELHIDAPVPSVTSRNSPPFIFLTPRYDLASLEADVDRIVGDVHANAALTATICDNPDSGIRGFIATVAGVIAGGAVGFVAGRRRRTSPAQS